MKKKIEGYEHYWVDTDGNVWSSKSGKMKILRSSQKENGYLQVTLCKNNKPKSILVHRLVAIAFLPNSENYLQVNHKNGIKTDNRLENLEWCNASQNNKHAFETGLRTQKGSRCNLAKLSEEQAIEIFVRIDNGESPTQIARDYPVSRKAISHMKLGESWSHLRTPKK